MDIPINKEPQDPVILHLDLKRMDLLDLASLFEIACQNEQYAEGALIRNAINRALDAIEFRSRNPEEEEEYDEEEEDEHYLPEPEI